MDKIERNPFAYYDWTDSELLFAMTFDKKNERMLVGTKEGILSHLRKNEEDIPSKDHADDVMRWKVSEERSLLKTVFSDIAKTVVDTARIGVGEAVRKEQARIYNRAERELSFVCDRSHYLGYLLLEFERDNESAWCEAIDNLVIALNCKGDKVKGSEEAARTFLQGRWKTRNPVCQYASLKVWQGYCAVRRCKVAAESELIPYAPKELPQLIERFEAEAKRLCEGFWKITDEKMSAGKKKLEWNDPILRLPSERESDCEELCVWTIPGVKTEVAVLEGSFDSMKQYCRIKMNEHGIKFCECLACGKIFTTHTLKQRTCSKACAMLRKANTTKGHHRKSKDDPVETVAKNTYQYWYNRIRKAEGIEEFPEEQLKELRDEFIKFKAELKSKKAEARQEKLNYREFTDWLAEKERLASNIMGEFEVRISRRRGNKD